MPAHPLRSGRGALRLHVIRALGVAAAFAAAAAHAGAPLNEPLPTCPPFLGWQSDPAGAASWRNAHEGGYAIIDEGRVVTDASLTSPALTIGPGWQLHMRHDGELSWANTAAVLEVSIDGAPWKDFVDAGGRFRSGGYNGSAFSTNPLGRRAAWVGRFVMWSVAEWPPAIAGGRARLRLRIGSSGTGDKRPGWHVQAMECSARRRQEHPVHVRGLPTSPEPDAFRP